MSFEPIDWELVELEEGPRVLEEQRAAHGRSMIEQIKAWHRAGRPVTVTEQEEQVVSSNEEHPSIAAREPLVFDTAGGWFHWAALDGAPGPLTQHDGRAQDCQLCADWTPPAKQWCAPSETLAAVTERCDCEDLVDLDEVMKDRAARRQDELAEELIREVPGLRAAQAIAVAKMLMDRYKLMNRDRYDQAIEALERLEALL